jgi:hypothetical protein
MCLLDDAVANDEADLASHLIPSLKGAMDSVPQRIVNHAA